jgi:hypothetical protein
LSKRRALAGSQTADRLSVSVEAARAWTVGIVAVTLMIAAATLVLGIVLVGG